eukprot:gb/GECG01000563.1/.p1 GENE.gb/GECG01000563.1/~~gb/GECG01000563.1/.p1  ORF type:complete len:237 (+),score=12.99 gb/GECG01000563.1/:1-711(+)
MVNTNGPNGTCVMRPQRARAAAPCSGTTYRLALPVLSRVYKLQILPSTPSTYVCICVLRKTSNMSDSSLTWFRFESPKTVGTSIVAATDIPPRTAVVRSRGKVRSSPTMHTVAVNEHQHVDVEGGMQFTAHSCSPNCRMVVELDSKETPSLVLETLRHVSQDEVLSFNYNTTEWDMAAPFDCQCDKCHIANSNNAGTPSRIAGMKHLNNEERKAIYTLASPFIKSKIDQELNREGL